MSDPAFTQDPRNRRPSGSKFAWIILLLASMSLLIGMILFKNSEPQEDPYSQETQDR